MESGSVRHAGRGAVLGKHALRRESCSVPWTVDHESWTMDDGAFGEVLPSFARNLLLEWELRGEGAATPAPGRCTACSLADQHALYSGGRWADGAACLTCLRCRQCRVSMVGYEPGDRVVPPRMAWLWQGSKVRGRWAIGIGHGPWAVVD